jgi:myo-inositol-1(or 4)-monophosphatase
MDYKDICTKTIDIVKDTGGFIRNEARKFSMDKVEVKGLHNFVSYVDKTAEERLVEQLHKLKPDAGFIAEEGTSESNGELFQWVIDPLDGTTNFIHGLPAYSISVALMEGNKTRLGVVYEINLDECFYSWGENLSWLNGKQISVSKAPTLKDSLIATGFPYYDFHKMRAYLDSLEYLMQNTHGARRIGTAAVDLAYVACGRFEAFYEYSLKPWDVAAGAFIVQQAGGIVTDFKGGDNYLFGSELIASNALVYNEFFNVVKRYLSNE